MNNVTLLVGVLALGAAVDCQKPKIDNRRHDVYIAGFFPFGRGVENSKTGRGVMPSVKLALDHVNDHSGVLRNYRLHMWWNDTECNAAVGVKAFFDMMHSGPHKLMLFGAACTHVTDPIAKASKHWHLTQLSYADTHPMFTSDNFPNFFRIVPSENAFNPPRISLLKKFNWTRVGTVYQNEPRYSLAHNRLLADLDTINAEIVETQSFGNEVNTALSKLKEKDVRIILGNFDESWARKIFCEAYSLGMYGKKYQWIIMGTYNEEWWSGHEFYENNCTSTDISVALEQTILTDLLPLSTTGEITVSGITADEYKFEYDSRRGLEYSRFHGYTYDGIWAVALAIQHVAHHLSAHRRNLTVIDFQYRDPEWEKLFLEALGNTSFEGVTGPVRFYGNERKASILLKQFQDGGEVKVGEYNAATDHLDLTLGAPLKWLGRYPPKDRTLEIIEHSQVNKTVYAIFASCAGIGIIMASIFLAINIKYRNQRYIKMSSPQLNNLIIVGCMLTYTSVVFLGLDSGLSSVGAFPYICTARAWTLMAGFSLAFGAMFSKTWRVHSIFTDVKLNKKVIKDYQLFMVVGVLLFIDLVIMTTWQVADPFYRATKQMEPYPHPSSDDIIIIQENEYCQSERMTIFIVSIYIYKGLLMILGAFLAWETRHVSIPALNDSRHVGLSVYNVVIICVCGAAVALVLSDRRDAAFAIIAIFIIFCTTTTLCLVFVPKLVELKRNPGGSIDKRIRATLRPMSKSGRRDSSATELEHRLKEVKTYNSKYRKTLLERESELQMLIRTLGADASDIIETKNGSTNDTSKCLSVPLLKRDPTSVTEPSDTTSLCSLSSTQDTGSKKRVQLPTTPVISVDTPKHVVGAAPVVQTVHVPQIQQTAYETATSTPTATTTTTTPSHDSPKARQGDKTTPVPIKSVEFLSHDMCITQNIVEAPKFPEKIPAVKQVPAVVVAAVQPLKVEAERKESSGGERPKMPTPKAEKKQYAVDVAHSPARDDVFEKETRWRTTDTYPRRGSVQRVEQMHAEAPAAGGVCHRRVSMPVNTRGPVVGLRECVGGAGVGRDAKTKKLDFSGHLVAKSELWDTGNQHRCTQKHKIGRVNIASQPDVNVHEDVEVQQSVSSMHRSVSEKNRHVRTQSTSAKVPLESSPSSASAPSASSSASATPKPTPHVDAKQPTPMTSLYNQQCNKYGYVQSTPNVAAIRPSAPGQSKKYDYEKSLISASSESELLDGAILPIFQKLLTERNKSQQQMNLSYGQSCPNISIKCDIVEYL